MPQKVRWGILGVAKIATVKVVPAMQRGALTEIVAIASRNPDKASAAAAQLGIPESFGSYEALLAHPGIDAIYNPLPNHLHVLWSVRAAEAGKHVLCEKPVALNAAGCRTLIEARDRTGVRIGEALMVRTHPQWLRARELVRSGAIGELVSISAAFSYSNRDPHNIRNVPEYGGGALMDIGCYPVQIARFLFGAEPVRVAGMLQRDPEFGTDRLVSAVLEFPSGHAVFTCGTQMAPYQRVQIFGTRARIGIEIPFNAPPDRPCRLFVDDGQDLFGSGVRVEEFAVCDQYTIQGDLFSEAILTGGEVPTPLEDSLANMVVIDKIFADAAAGARVGAATVKERTFPPGL